MLRNHASSVAGSRQAPLESTRAANDARLPSRPTALGRHARRFVAVSSLLLVAACSSIKLGYNNADTLLVYALDSYLDLDDRQSELARERVRTLMAWHRSTQLAGYAQLMDDAQRRFATSAAPVAADEVLALQAEMNARIARVADQAAPDIALLATTLTPAQIDRMADKLAADAAKAQREAAKPGAQDIDARVKRYADRARDWLGALSPAQREIVRASLAARPDGNAFWQVESERRRELLLSLLRRVHTERASAEQTATWLREYFAELAEPRDPTRRATVLAWRRANAELMAQLVNSATPEQRVALGKKLRGYAQDFSALATEAGRS